MTTTLDKPDTRETAGDPRPRRRLNTPMLLAYLTLTVGIVVTLFPFMWMLLTSFKSFQELFNLSFFPAAPTLDNYRQVLLETKFIQWFGNSLLIAGVTTASVLFFDSMVGYTLAKFDFPGKNLIFILILSTLMIPTEMLVIPWYLMSAKLGWLNTYWGIMFPGLMTAFGTFLMKQFFEGVPNDFLEAARVDGLNEFTIWWKIAMPMVVPAISALAIFTFLGNWTAFFWPLIVTTSKELYTLPVGISSFSAEASIQWELIMTGAAIGTIPTLLVFLLLQRYIVRGVMLAGLKG